MFPATHIPLQRLSLFLSVGLALSLSCRGTEPPATPTELEMPPPKCTVVADLPDSTRPRSIPLAAFPPPRKIAVPQKSGGEYQIQTRNGPRAIPLNPPARHEFKDTLTGQFAPPEAQGMVTFQTFDSEDGLAMDAISCSFADRDGNLWFGSHGAGVTRYNGHAFTTFNTSHGLARNDVTDIVQDHAGNMWFATAGGGVSKFDGVAFETFTTHDGLAHNILLSALVDAQGILWFGGNDGRLSRYNGQQFSIVTSTDPWPRAAITAIAEDPRGRLWLVTRGQGAFRFDGEALEAFNAADGLGSNVIFDVHIDRQGSVWFAAYGHGFSRYDGQGFSSITLQNGLANNAAMAIAEDSTGQMWFGTRGGGVSRYAHGHVTNFTRQQGLPNDHVHDILVDQSDYLWFSTHGGGVVRYDGHAFVNYTTRHGLPNSIVLSISQDSNGILWFGGQSGLIRYDEKSMATFDMSQGLANMVVNASTVDRSGNLWLGTVGGLSHFDGTTFTNYGRAQGLRSDYIWNITEDRSGNLWFATYGAGACRFDGESWTFYDTTTGLADNIIYCMEEDRQGNLWFGTDHGGVSRYDGKAFINFGKVHGLGADVVYDIKEDSEGNLWFGTAGGGLSMLSSAVLGDLDRAIADAAHGLADADWWQRIPKPLFRTWSTADGFPDNTITQILPVSQGRLYLGTNHGFFDFQQIEVHDWMVGRMYNTGTGYPVKDVNVGQHGMFQDRDGIIWIGTGSDKTALVRFDPQALHAKARPPKIQIGKVSINKEALCWRGLLLEKGGYEEGERWESAMAVAQLQAFGRSVHQELLTEQLKGFAGIGVDSLSKWYDIPQGLVLPHRHNSIGFDFFALETGRNIELRYQYMLEGYDEDWSPETQLTTATFGNIGEGTYRFRVRVRRGAAPWGQPLVYTFEVRPPWWRTTWMYIAYIILSMGMLGGLIRWRESRLKREKVVLEAKVKVRTRELEERNKVVAEQKKEVEHEKRKGDELLRNILPAQVAEEMKATGQTAARYYESVTVLFTDFKDFTTISERLGAQELVNEIHQYYSAFDEITARHGVEKLKTIGDGYMAAGGLPEPSLDHAVRVVKAAVEIRDFVSSERIRRLKEGRPAFEIRIGCHSGPVVSGIVGTRKFAYDIWGDTVNIAARMQQACEEGRINISETTYALIQDHVHAEARGKIEVKGKGEMEMFFVSGCA